jgi:WD40 repeat protein
MRMTDLNENLDGHVAAITHVAVRPDGERLATCSSAGTVIVWDSTDPEHLEVRHQLRHQRLVSAAAWHPSHPDLLATASADGTVVVWRIWDGTAPQVVSVLARHNDDVDAVAWLPDGERLACMSAAGRVALWHAFTGAYLGEVGSQDAHALTARIGGDRLIATGADDLVAVVRSGPLGDAVTRS